MLSRIVHNSPPLCAFARPLLSSLSEPQERHFLNLADGLLVCEDKKTLAALQRQFIESVDVSNWADFLRISPWNASEVRDRIRQANIAWAIEQAEAAGEPKEVFINIDDSIGEKGAQTWRLEPVDWFHDHKESTPKHPRYKKGFCYLACTMRIGKIVVTVDLRLYLRARTVRIINRGRELEERIRFRSKNHLAKNMLAAIEPLLPKGWEVIVQFDSWYASEKILKFIHRRKWKLTCALKFNRQLNGQRLDHHAGELKHKRYTFVSVTAADGAKSKYLVRHLDGRLNDVPFNLRVLFSKRHNGGRSSLAYFGSTRMTCTAQTILRGYYWRWSCEVVNFYLKTQLGLADFRVRSFEAVDKYLVVVHLAWAYVEQRFVKERSARIKCYGDLIRRHREEHEVELVKDILRMAQAGHSEEEILQRFLHLEPALAE
jgi:hypothetical protein